MARIGERKIGAALSAMLALLGVFTLALGCWPCQSKWLFFLAPAPHSLKAIGTAQLLSSIVLRGSFPRTALFLAAISLSGTAGFSAYRHVKWSKAPLLSKGEDAYFSVNGGRRATPGSVWRQAYYPDYRVTCTFDEECQRYIPAPASSQGDLFVLGCSFTFGTGVDDDECWPALLARDLWRDYRVRNLAVAGWGAADNYLHLQDRLASGPPPALVVYGWSAVQITRNYLRAQWWQAIRAWPNAVAPHFEVENQRLAFKGLVSSSHWLESSPELRSKEETISAALLQGMAELCREKQTRFVVVRLDNNIGEQDEQTFDSMLKAGLDAIDARPPENLYFPHEKNHGKPAWHRAVADAVRKDPRAAVQYNAAADDR